MEYIYFRVTITMIKFQKKVADAKTLTYIKFAWIIMQVLFLTYGKCKAPQMCVNIVLYCRY